MEELREQIRTIVRNENLLDIDMADAILALPAFQQMREDAEAYRTIRDNIPPCPAAQLDDCPWCKESGQGKIAEWKEKADERDQLYQMVTTGIGYCYQSKNVDNLVLLEKAVNGFLADAKKWKQKAAERDLLMEGLERR